MRKDKQYKIIKKKKKKIKKKMVKTQIGVLD
jgi:hypothetical protein